MLGRHFLIGLRPTPDLHPDDRRLLETLRPAGVILFRGNFEAGVPYEQWHARLAGLIGAARDAIGREDVLVCVDHEGGTVLRPPPPITRYAFARQWADRAGAVGRAMGIELASLGFNVNFAPVVDIHSNPKNPVIGPRAFATTADEVAAAAGELIASMQAEGVLACPKHFPGHGDTSVDSHLELPVLDVDEAALRARELRPFAQVIATGQVHLIMTAHIMFPRIDPTHPATLSATFVAGLLRGELGYRGAVVTDDVGMRAVSTLFDAPGAAARMLASGTDLLMLCSHWTSTDRAYPIAEDLQRSIDRGDVHPAVLAASGARVDTLLAASRKNQPRLLPPETFAAHAALAPLQQTQGKVGQTVSLEEG